MHPNRKITRREAIKGAAGCAAAVLVSPLAKAKGRSLIREENAKPGTRDWMLDNTRIDPATKYRCPWIEGYCSSASVRAGETVTFHVSTNPASRFKIDIYRLGYYGGDGGRLVKQLGSFDGKTQDDPPTDPKRLRDCAWKPCAGLKIPADWLSGVYVGKLTAERDGTQSYAIFIVRDERAADLIFQCSDNTWQAYNRWPSQFSLYDDGVDIWYWGGDVQVSYNRPYARKSHLVKSPLSTGSGEFFLWEFPFAFWLEQHGYDVTYISNLDTHRDAAGLLRARGFLSVGHDEYWTMEMFRNVQAAVAKGVSVGFFSGNAICGRVAFDKRLRAFERIGVFGPPGGTVEYKAMSTLKHERPYANELIGAHTTGPVTGSGDWVCSLPDHWIYKGTGMKKGDAIPGLIGWEFHGDPAPIPGLEVVATSPLIDVKKNPNGGVHTGTVYPGPKGNIVFNAGTCWWADGLGEPPGYQRPKYPCQPKGPDARVQRITANVLNRMLRVG